MRKIERKREIENGSKIARSKYKRERERERERGEVRINKKERG